MDSATNQSDKPDDAPALPFDEALKRVWGAPPQPKLKAASKPPDTKTKPRSPRQGKA